MSNANALEFCNITGTEYATGVRFLEAAGGNLETAVTLFFASGEGGGGGAGGGAARAPVAANTSPPPPASGTTASHSATASGRSKSGSSQPPPRRGNVATFRDLNKGGGGGGDDDDDDDDDKDGHNEYYSGGHSSGIAVQGGRKADRSPGAAGEDDVVSGVFAAARAQGAKERHLHEEEEGGSGKAPKPSYFGGTGYSLGTTVSGSKPLPAVAANPPPPPTSKVVKLQFWKQGFTVDEGPLRPYTDAANKSFLEDINRGVAPREIQPPHPSTKIDIHLVDRKGEDYSAPPPGPVKITPFAGSGQTLGSSASTSAGGSTSTSTSTAAATTTSVAASPSTFLEVDQSAPTTSVQVRLHDGTRLTATFNESHTVGDLYGFVRAAVVLPRGSSFELREAMPPKTIVEGTQTLAEAGLLNSVVIQRLL